MELFMASETSNHTSTTTAGPKQIAGDLARELRRAVQTTSNDDGSLPGTDERSRHIQRVNAMWAAAEFLEEIATA
jgi:hypothetical protein